MSCLICHTNPCICFQFVPPVGNSFTLKWPPDPIPHPPLSEKDIARIAEKVVLAISAERKELEELRAFKAGILALLGK